MAVHEWFQPLDWIVLFGYLGLTTWVGHKMRGRQASMSDFFAGGRSLPWLAVSGSIVATEISGVTFIGVPGGVLVVILGSAMSLVTRSRAREAREQRETPHEKPLTGRSRGQQRFLMRSV